MQQLSKYFNKPAQSTRSYNHDLQDYMFTKENIERLLKLLQPLPEVIEVIKEKPVLTTTPTTITVKVKAVKKQPKIYKPKQKDTLFWCYYIMKYGFSNYEMEIHNQYFSVEMKEKYDCIAAVRETDNKNILKIHKIKPLSDVETDLSANPRISLKTFFALCAISKLNVILVDKRKIFEISSSDSGETFVVHKNPYGGDYWLELDQTPEMIAKYRNEYFNVLGFEQGLKALSSYKMDELVELAKRFDIKIVEGKKYLKKDIYELILAAY